MRYWAALVWLVLPGAAAADADAWFQRGPYVQRPAPGAFEIHWEGAGARAAEAELLGEDGRVERTEPAARQAARFEDLEPGARYRYAIRAGEAAASGAFRAAPEPGGRASFVVAGGTRLDEDVQELLASALEAENPDFWLGTGNLVSDGLSEHEWDRLFSTYRGVLARAPLFPAVGTNDLEGDQRTAAHFDALFSLPGQRASEEVGGGDPRPRRYAFSFGPAFVIVLDSATRGEPLEEQAAWLEGELERARAREGTEQIFVATHHGPLSVGLSGGDERVREAWQPLFEEYEVDAVFSGHDHVYSRSEEGGVRYFVTAGGGAALYPRSDDPDSPSEDALEHFASTHHYLRVDVRGGLAEVRAVHLDGTAFDAARWGEPEPLSEKEEAFIAELERPLPAEEAGRAAKPAARADESAGRRRALGMSAAAAGLSLAALAGGALAWLYRRERLRG